MPSTTTTTSGLRTPLSTEAPDGPGAITSLAADVDQFFRIDGAEYCANLTAIQAIPAARLYKRKTAYAADTDITWSYDGAAWKEYDSAWITSLQDVYGLSGAYNASPGWAISKMQYRWVSGMVRFRGQFSINGSGTSSGQLGVKLPVAAEVGVFNRPIGNCVAQNSSDSNSLAVIVPVINGAGTAAYFNGHRVNGSNASRLEPVNGTIPLGEALAQSDEFQFDFIYARA